MQQVRYEFRDGMPPEKCKPYSDKEWSRLLSSIITPEVKSSQIQSPTAIFITGLPGGGKSKSLDLIFNSICRHLPKRENFAVVDFDHMRSFHEQYVTYSNTPHLEDPSARLSYYDLVPWFLEGTDFETTVFRTSPNRGLFPLIFANRYSFVMEGVLDSSSCFSFVQHTASCGYTLIFAFVHNPLEKAISRAEKRAYHTGRWSSRQFISSRYPGLIEWFPVIAWFVLHENVGGTVALFDNTRDGKDPELIYHATPSSIPSPPSLPPWDLYLLAKLTTATVTPKEELVYLSKQRLHNLVMTFALEEMTKLFSILLSSPIARAISIHKPLEIISKSNNSISFCLAGGSFKKLITNKVPRDLDIWPCSESDKEKLFQIFNSARTTHVVADSPFNVKYEILTSPPAFVEIVKKSNPPDLQGKVERFDMALSAVGVQFILSQTEHSWTLCATDIYVHRDWVRSLELRIPLLIIPMPNAPYILATAERVIRYASELNWPMPKDPLEYLVQQWKQAVVSGKVSERELIDKYRATTRGGEAQHVVCELFGVSL